MLWLIDDSTPTCDRGCAHDSGSHLKRRPDLDGQTGSGAEAMFDFVTGN
jgi:hypothetical protein